MLLAGPLVEMEVRVRVAGDCRIAQLGEQYVAKPKQFNSGCYDR